MGPRRKNILGIKTFNSFFKVQDLIPNSKTEATSSILQ